MAERLFVTIGGCAANAAVDLAKMGVATAVVGRVGKDVFGKVVADLLQDHGVDVSALRASPKADTSQTMIVNVAGQDRRFIHSFGANAEFEAGDIPLERLSRCKVLYLGGYFLMDAIRAEELASVFASAQRAGVRTVLDVVIPRPGEYLSRLEPLLPHVDVFLPNTQEAEIITCDSDPLRQAKLFHRLGAATVVITMGGDGAVLVNNDIRLRAGVYRVPMVDGSGGGDAFDAGFIFGILHDMDAENCLRVASALGASCVRAVGTTPGVFTRQECEAFIRENPLRIETL